MSDSSWFDRIAHDLRGPLMPLQTAAYLLRSERSTGQLDGQRQQELVEIIERQSRRLGRMIDEIGDWSRAQQQRLLGPRAACELATMIDLAIGAIPGCTVEPRLAPDCAAICVDCDQLRLVQMFKALLEYAQSRGGAAVDVRRDGDTVQVRVIDSGELPDAAVLPALLTQPDPAPHDDGLGLRLLVARAIVEAHGGTLAVEPAASGLVLRCDLPIAAIEGGCS